MLFSTLRREAGRFATAALALGFLALPVQSDTSLTAYSQALAVAAASDAAVSTFYRTHDYATLWTGPQDAARRQALLTVLAAAGLHALPLERYDANALRGAFRAVQTEGDRGRLEVAMTEAYLAYARDVASGVLVPSSVDPTIKREVTRPDPLWLLARANAADFAGFLADLPPDAPQYVQLMKEKIRLERLIAHRGFGPEIEVASLQPGVEGDAVVQLRNRLVVLGLMGRSATQVYDGAITAAVQRFQLDNGITADGVAGESTIAALNSEPADRLRSVVVAMERLRWMGDADLGARHIWVNQPDFTAQIIDNGRVTFQTRAVIGKSGLDTRSPEFSDQMEFMVVNPSWSVPRSITTKEYLPMLRNNPNAQGQLQVVDRNGRVVPRDQVNFAAYTAANFPYALRQAPSDGNALGKVKFMFPNPNNIYLHDTPSKSLFANEIRAYSHGCIRLADPMDFAYTLLARQTDDPKAEFKRYLDTGRETRLDLATPVPVHLVYFTAWPNAKGQMSYRRDIYGRDAAIFQALTEAGVVLGGVQG